MHNFILRELNNINAQEELAEIGYDSSYVLQSLPKLAFKLVKVYALSPAQANILKQTAISVGADCMTHRDVITGKIEKSDAIITATVSELKKIAQKLVFQPFGLKVLAEKILGICEENNCLWTKIIGILNITDNSFSDGGKYLNIEDAKKHVINLIEDGADGIDIGAESTKPYSSPVDANTQLQRIIPVLDFLEKENIHIPVSIDTRSAKVAEEVLKRGNYIINDVSGFDYDKSMSDIIAKYNATVVLQHSQGRPENMQDKPEYNNVVEDIYLALEKKVSFAHSRGIENIIIDPGIGFGKTKADNLEILERIEDFFSIKCPVMVGVSRKTFLGNSDNTDKDVYTLALNSRLIEKKVDYLRVHNVKLHKEFMNILLKQDKIA